MADQYDDVIKRLVSERANASLIVTKPAPDAVGRANAVATQTGVPPETADRNLAQLEQEVQAARARTAIGSDPALAIWAGDPRHAGVASDEMDHLARNREYWNRLSGDAMITATPAPAPTIGNFFRGLATNFVEGGREAVAGIQQLGADWLPNMAPRSASNVPTLGDYEQENLSRTYNRAELHIAAAQPAFKSALGRDLYGGASSVAQMVPAFGIGALTGNPEAGLALGGLQQGLPAYSKYRSRGAGKGMALAGGVGEGAIEVLTEKLPMDFLVNKFGKIGAGKFISGFLGRELPSEMAATLGQNAVDTAIANPDKTWGEYLREQPDQLAQTAIGTLLTVGFFGGIHRGAKKFAGEADEQARAVDQGDALTKAMAGAAESKARGRDPEAFAKLIALRTEGTPAEQLYVPAEKVASYFQSDGADYHRDEFWADYASQIDEGLATGGDVVIPTARAAAHLAGTPAWEAIEPDVRMSPGGMSVAEAKSLEASHSAAMEQLGAQMAEQLAEQQKADEPRQKIYQDIRDKLTGAGYTQDAAHLNAELVAQRYATRAARLGQDLTGTETADIAVNSVLPPNLAPIVAADPGNVALKSVINVMRGKSATTKQVSLLDWIRQQGGIEDRGGDLRAMGAGSIKGVSRKGERKIIRDHVAAGQGEMLAQGEQQNVNTPDELALRAQGAGYFPAGERPTVNDLFAKIEQELRGTPVHAEQLPEEVQRTRAAADELERILDQQGLDPNTASDSDIGKAIDSYRQAQEGGLQQAVFHGSPHIFDKFSLDHIGSGEGAQAYGYGLYFAGKKEIAAHYREVLAGSPQYSTADYAEYFKPGRIINGYGGKDKVIAFHPGPEGEPWNWSVTVRRVRADGSDMPGERERNHSTHPSAAEMKAVLGRVPTERPGRLYHVDIPDDHEFLNWDDHLAGRDKDAFVKAFRQLGNENWRAKDFADALDSHAEITGREAYKRLVAAIGASRSKLEAVVQNPYARTDQIASELLHTAGIAGIKYLDGSSRDTGDGSHNYVLFDDSRASIRSYEQTFADGPRGQISFGNGKSVIDLFESRNLSTFIHEMGHQWLEELRQDAAADGASDQIKADWRAVQDWFKANGHGVTDGAIPVDAHELWARGVERFAMEGKSPSTALRRVFEAFKGWMLSIYQVVDNLHAPITPEIRDVMQRLVATDEEIAAAQEKEAISALFTDAAQAGMTEAQFAEYQKAASEARDEAHDALLYRTMASVRAERTKAWKDEERGVRDDVTQRVNRRPEFKALHLLRTGRMLDHPDAPVRKVRLDKGALVEAYGEGILASLPKGVPPLYAEHGTNIDDVAEMVGFESGDQMVRTLVTVEDRTRELRDAGDKRSVRQALIDDEVDAEMKARHGDILSDGSIEQEALALIHNDRQGEVMAAELRSLSRRANKQPTPYSLAKEWARDKIAQSAVSEATSGAAIQRYTRAAAKAGKAAEAAMVKGDIEETYRQKQAQMLNNALIAEAHRVRSLVEKARDRLASYAKRRTIKSMDQDYLDQIHGLLEQVEFRQRPQSAIERQQSFEEWARGREAEGLDVIAPASFAASLGTTNWSRLSVEKLLGLDDTVKQIAHLGRLKQELLDGKERREFQAVVDEALGSIDKLPPRPPSDLMDPTWGDRIKGRIASIDASLLKMETIVDWLDGGNSEGVFNRVVFKPIADAQSRERDMLTDYYGLVRGAMEAVPGEAIKKWQDRITIPELINRETGNPFVMSRQRLVAMALNVGNEGNIQRLADGYGWNRDQVLAVLNRELSAPEWQFVQQVWDIIDTLWPQISEMERRVNGVEPEKVEATPIETLAGTLRGGYYPAIYDQTRDLDSERHAGAASDLLETTYTKATTRASSTKDRANKVKRPILLDLGVINRHLGEVIHDVTHREVIINADKFLSDPRIAKAVNDTLGPEVRKQFRPWLKFVANQWAMERSGNEGLGKFLNKARANTTAVGMGFRVSTIMTQLAGYSNSFEVVGAKWVSHAMVQTMQHPVESFKMVMEKSGEVRHRMDTLDRDINIGINALAGRRDLIADAKRFAYHGIGYTDRMVVLPTWIGAYNKALASGKTEDQAVYEGDKAVRQSQGAGAAKDLAAVQRGTGKWGELLKITTMFYSYMSAVYQRQRTLGRDTATAVREGNARMTPQLLARAWWLLAVPPVLSELLAGRGPDDDEDWATWAFKQMLFNLLGPIPLARDLVQPVWDGIAGNKSFGAQISPMQRVYDTISLTAKDIGHVAHGDETKHMTKDVLETSGYATGVVPGQIASAAQFLVDVGNGSQNPQTAADWWRGITTGHAEKR